MSETALISSGARSGGRGAVRAAVRFLSPVLSLAVVVGAFAILAPDAPITMDTVRTVALQTVIVGTAALGMTLVIISGGVDLSVGSAAALAGVAAALAMRSGIPALGAVGIAVATGAACGLYNGLLVTVLRLPPFIATLGTLGFFRGVAKWLASSGAVRVRREGGIGWLGDWVQMTPEPRWLVVAPAVWVTLGLGVLTAAMLKFTVFGRHVVAIGSNQDAASRCGLAVKRIKAAVYVVAGLFVGLAGLVQFARLTEGDSTVAVGLELDVIAAVIIGGASLSGGQGSVAGTLAGAVLMAFLRNRCTVLGWPNFVQEMIVGHIIIVAVGIDQWRVRRGVR
jgi:ribose transport system permease protein